MLVAVQEVFFGSWMGQRGAGPVCCVFLNSGCFLVLNVVVIACPSLRNYALEPELFSVDYFWLVLTCQGLVLYPGKWCWRSVRSGVLSGFCKHFRVSIVFNHFCAQIGVPRGCTDRRDAQKYGAHSGQKPVREDFARDEDHSYWNLQHHVGAHLSLRRASACRL